MTFLKRKHSNEIKTRSINLATETIEKNNSLKMETIKIEDFLLKKIMKKDLKIMIEGKNKEAIREFKISKGIQEAAIKNLTKEMKEISREEIIRSITEIAKKISINLKEMKGGETEKEETVIEMSAVMKEMKEAEVEGEGKDLIRKTLIEIRGMTAIEISIKGQEILIK